MKRALAMLVGCVVPSAAPALAQNRDPTDFEALIDQHTPQTPHLVH